MRKLSCLLLLVAVACSGLQGVDMALVPPGSVTDKTDVDIRTGIVNRGSATAVYDVSLTLRDSRGCKELSRFKAEVAPGESLLIRDTLFTQGLSGKYDVLAKVRKGLKTTTLSRPIEVIPSSCRSPQTIDGAWVGLYHWSEQEGLHWNKDIRQLTADDWKGVVRAMHHIGMDVVVIQELLRNEERDVTVESYPGRAYYPSDIYSARMDIACPDPVEAILEEADRLGMYVLPGIGLFSWFDFSDESLEWHKLITSEVLRKYGHHPSFYGFYVSEESPGSLDNWAQDEAARSRNISQIVSFFREYTAYCRTLAPAKPVMLATNCFGISGRDDAYAALLPHLDILCPFGFSRLPQSDLSAPEAISLLQRWCDSSSCHLWLDLEAFTFNPDGSLSPRPFNAPDASAAVAAGSDAAGTPNPATTDSSCAAGSDAAAPSASQSTPSIRDELNTLTTFEKVLCYQYPGVFSNPSFHPQVGEESSIKLYTDYAAYLQTLD